MKHLDLRLAGLHWSHARSTLLIRVLAEFLHGKGEAFLDLLLVEFSRDVVILLGDVGIAGEEHGTPHREMDGDDEQRDADDSESHVHDAFIDRD